MKQKQLTQAAFADGVKILEAATGREIKPDHLPIWYEAFQELTDDDFVNGCKMFIRHIGGWLEIAKVWEGVQLHRDQPRQRLTAAQQAYVDKKLADRDTGDVAHAN